MQDRLPNEVWELYLEYQSGIHDHETIGIDKERLAMQTIQEFSGLADVLGHEKASEEMATVLEDYVLAGELTEFESTLIQVVAQLGKIATFAMDENERLRHDV